MRKYVCTALAVALSVMFARTARAETIEAHLVSVVPSGPNFVYNYQLVLTNGNGLANSVGDHPAFESGLIILDFYGLVSASLSVSGGDITAVADWNVATPLTGGSPLDSTIYSPVPILGNNTFLQGTSPNSIAGGPDHPAVSNVVLQYEGADLAVDIVNPRPLI